MVSRKQDSDEEVVAAAATMEVTDLENAEDNKHLDRNADDEISKAETYDIEAEQATTQDVDGDGRLGRNSVEAWNDRVSVRTENGHHGDGEESGDVHNAHDSQDWNSEDDGGGTDGEDMHEGNGVTISGHRNSQDHIGSSSTINIDNVKVQRGKKGQKLKGRSGKSATNAIEWSEYCDKQSTTDRRETRGKRSKAAPPHNDNSNNSNSNATELPEREDVFHPAQQSHDCDLDPNMGVFITEESIGDDNDRTMRDLQKRHLTERRRIVELERQRLADLRHKSRAAGVIQKNWRM